MKKRKNLMTSLDAERYFTDESKGLSTAQVELRIQDGLVNETTNDLTKTYFKIITKNVFTFFNLMCFVCFIALLCVKAPISDFSFMVIYIINLTISIVQEIRAKIALERMSIVSTPKVNVIRDKELKEIATSDLVLDDIIKLSIGDQIPCDCILINGFCEANEALLTGESIPVKKVNGDTLLGGSYLTSGTCYARVEKIGNESYVQQLSLAAKKHKSPNSRLLSSLNTIIKTVGVLIIPIAIIMGSINYSVAVSEYAGIELARQVVTRTSTVIIGMIPAGMFLLTTMALAVGVINLSKINTLAKDKYSLEMLARVDVLCLDKTGTITDGQMVVKEVVDINPIKSITTSQAIYAIQTALKDNNQTSNALNAYFTSGNELSPIQLMPFSSDRKFSAVTFKDYGTFVLGAPNYVFPNLDKNVDSEVKKHASLGRRVLLLAHSNSPIVGDTIPTDIKPSSLIIMEDNIRKEAIETIKWFKENDVEVKVISGDDPLTVSEISKRAGIENADKYINLYGLSEEEVIESANNYTVFGRVSPEQKAILVKALKNSGHTVAMTGDGVNDILAMKEADCSVTVATGSDAAKSVAQLVLFDNNFNSMPRVVLEGRRVINNIQRSSSLYLMKTIFTFVFALISIISRQEYPFSPGMMVMLEFCVIGVPSFFLSLQPNSERVEGNFIAQMLLNAIPGSLILICNIFIVRFVINLVGLDVTNKLLLNSMEVIVITFGGWAFLVRLCQPCDTYRGSVAIGSTILLLVCVLFLMDSQLFNLFSFFKSMNYWQNVLIMLCIIQFDFPLLALFTKGMQYIIKLALKDKKLLKKS